MMTAFSFGFTRSMRAMAASTSSRGLALRWRTRSACAVASRRASSSLIGRRYANRRAEVYCPGPEVRCQSRGWIGGAGKARRRGIVGAIPRRSNAASVVETPPNLVTDFGFGTLVERFELLLVAGEHAAALQLEGRRQHAVVGREVLAHQQELLRALIALERPAVLLDLVGDERPDSLVLGHVAGVHPVVPYPAADRFRVRHDQRHVEGLVRAVHHHVGDVG